jgi:hypothetical protein
LPDINIVSHDWFLYQLITAIDGLFIFDNVPQVIYRQHSSSLIGENTSLISKLIRFKLVMEGRYSQWSALNISALNLIRDKIASHNLDTLDIFIKLRDAKKMKDRLRLLNVSGIYRQSRSETIFLMIAVIFKKI